MVTCSPTRTRSGRSVIIPLLAVENEVEGTATPDEDVLAALAVGAVEAAPGEPLVDGLDGQAQQSGQPGRGEDRRDRGPAVAGKGPADLLPVQRPLPRAHHRPLVE